MIYLQLQFSNDSDNHVGNFKILDGSRIRRKMTEISKNRELNIKRVEHSVASHRKPSKRPIASQSQLNYLQRMYGALPLKGIPKSLLRVYVCVWSCEGSDHTQRLTCVRTCTGRYR